MHTQYDDLRWTEKGEGWSEAHVELGKDDTAWNPGSTKYPIYGPAYVVYERHRSGISGYVYGTKAEADAAVVKP